MLSFDVDGESLWIARDPALKDRPIHMSMGAYGPKVAVPRILTLLDRYDLKAGFFIPGWIIERYPDMAQEILLRGHEIGRHDFGFSANPPVGNGVWSQQEVYEIWSEEFESAYEEGGFFNLMMHPQVIGRPSRMRMVERLIGKILEKGDVWIARPIEIAGYWLDQGYSGGKPLDTA